MKSDSRSIQSEFKALKEVMICPAKHAFASQAKLSSQWQELNYLSQPDYRKAELEYAEFNGILTDRDIAIKELVDVKGVRENPIIGYGLVIGLNGTGDGGGEIVAVGTPEEVAKVEASHTGRYLGPMLEAKSKVAAE